MLLQVTHETRYDYVPPVEVAQHMAYLQPWTSAAQQLISHSLRVEPRPAQQTAAVDVYGNRRTFLSLQTPHAQLRVVATSTVSTLGRPMPSSTVAWEPVRERFRYRADAVYDPAAEFVFASQHAPRQPEFAAYARPSFTPGAGLFDATRDLMHRIHEDFTYDSRSTQINTPALEALAQRKGVCQDFAHIMIACLRSIGLAARYVSGYLLTTPAPGEQKLIGSDASHAWVSVLLPDLPGDERWCDFDPTNDRWGWGLPGEDYVLLATGRDYADVSPIRGVIHGGANHRLAVAVTVTRLDAPDAAPALVPQGQPQVTQNQSQSQSG
jgi:transglutaminase-like putative cysteine protease